MKTSSNSLGRFSLLGAFALAGALSLGAARGEVVFDNSAKIDTNPVHGANGVLRIAGVDKGPYEFGDDLTLAGNYRLVNQFVFHYFGDIANTAVSTAKIRFYANDQSIVDPVSGKTLAAPGSLLWTSDPFNVVKGGVEVSMPVPLVKVPNTFTYSIEVTGTTGTSGDQVGLYTSTGKADIGSSFNDFWIKSDTGWTISNLNGTGAARADFAVTVNAVPEPGTLALMALGLGASFILVRRQRGQA